MSVVLFIHRIMYREGALVLVLALCNGALFHFVPQSIVIHTGIYKQWNETEQTFCGKTNFKTEFELQRKIATIVSFIIIIIIIVIINLY